MSSQSDTEAGSFTTFLDWSAPRLDLRFSQPPYDSTLLSLQTASCLLPLLVVNGESTRASTTAAATVRSETSCLTSASPKTVDQRNRRSKFVNGNREKAHPSRPDRVVLS